jgi:hypothetical protein
MIFLRLRSWRPSLQAWLDQARAGQAEHPRTSVDVSESEKFPILQKSSMQF